MVDITPLAFRILRSTRLPMAPEADVQSAIAQAWTDAGIQFEAEVRLSKAERIDFVVGTVGVEVKVKGPARAILRQLERYADFPQLSALVLVSSVAMGLPQTINGKPVSILSLGRAWL